MQDLERVGNNVRDVEAENTDDEAVRNEVMRRSADCYVGTHRQIFLLRLSAHSPFQGVLMPDGPNLHHPPDLSCGFHK